MSTYFPKANETQAPVVPGGCHRHRRGPPEHRRGGCPVRQEQTDLDPFLDTGDHVIVINAEKAVLTGKKGVQKIYRRTTTQPGSMKESVPR